MASVIFSPLAPTTPPQPTPTVTPLPSAPARKPAQSSKRKHRPTKQPSNKKVATEMTPRQHAEVFRRNFSATLAAGRDGFVEAAKAASTTPPMPLSILIAKLNITIQRLEKIIAFPYCRSTNRYTLSRLITDHSPKLTGQAEFLVAVKLLSKDDELALHTVVSKTTAYFNSEAGDYQKSTSIANKVQGTIESGDQTKGWHIDNGLSNNGSVLYLMFHEIPPELMWGSIGSTYPSHIEPDGVRRMLDTFIKGVATELRNQPNPPAYLTEQSLYIEAADYYRRLHGLDFFDRAGRWSKRIRDCSPLDGVSFAIDTLPALLEASMCTFICDGELPDLTDSDFDSDSDEE